MKYFIFMMTSILLTSCRPLPVYRPPNFPISSNWKESKGESATHQVKLEKWWHIFDDPLLDELEETGLEYNPTIETALWRVSEALSQTQAAISAFYPLLTFAPNTFNQLQLVRIPEITNFSTTGTQPIFDFEPTRRIKTTQYTYPFVASYEFDLWYRIRYEAEAAYANAQAQQEAWRSAQLTITTAIANSYFTIRIHDAEEKILNDTIRVRTDAFEINQIRYQAGLINYADVSRAETELWLAKVDLSRTTQARALQEHLLASLIGELPSCFSQSSLPLEGQPPLIIPILPSEALLRRPDLAQAERTLASQYAEEGAAYASLFPSLSLTTQLGFSSPLVGELLNWKARFFSLAWEGLQTIFDAGYKESTITAARSRFEQALNHYREKVLTAFKEVEDALVSIQLEKTSFEQLTHATESATISTQLAQERYDKGLVTYLEVVDAERTLLTTQLSTVRAQGDQFLSTVDLVKAIGGSWDAPM